MRKLTDTKVQSYLQKSRLLGTLTTCKSEDNHKYYLIQKSKSSYELLIPDDVQILSGVDIESDCYAELKVVGGSGLINTSGMFSYPNSLNIKSIDLTDMDTSNVKDMSRMFMGCKAKEINISKLNTSNVEDMFGMFEGCELDRLNLSSLDTSKVTNMSFMFEYCNIPEIDLRSFNTSNVIDMRSMFQYCKAETIYLRSFDTSKVIDMSTMFSACKTRSLDLSSFTTNRLESGFYTMFLHYHGRIKATDKNILKSYIEG